MLYLEFDKTNPKKIEVNCPFCLSESSKLFFKYIESDYRKCNECDSIYMSPRLSNEWLRKYYQFIDKKYYFDISDKRREKRIEYLIISRFELIIRKIQKFKFSNFSNYLEIGPGVGYFTEVAIRRNLSKNYI